MHLVKLLKDICGSTAENSSSRLLLSGNQQRRVVSSSTKFLRRESLATLKKGKEIYIHEETSSAMNLELFRAQNWVEMERESGGITK